MEGLWAVTPSRGLNHFCCFCCLYILYFAVIVLFFFLNYVVNNPFLLHSALIGTMIFGMKVLKIIPIRTPTVTARSFIASFHLMRACKDWVTSSTTGFYSKTSSWFPVHPSWRQLVSSDELFTPPGSFTIGMVTNISRCLLMFASVVGSVEMEVS